MPGETQVSNPTKELEDFNKRVAEKELAKQREMADAARAELAKGRFDEWWQNYIEKLRQKGYITNYHGQQVELWDHVLSEANKMTNKMDGQSFNTWASAMMELMAILSVMVDAIDHSIDTFLATTLVDFPIFGKMPLKFNRLAEGKIIEGLQNTKDLVMDKIRGAMRTVLPKVQYDVSYNDEKGLSVKINLNNNVDPATEETDAFDGVVRSWLKTHGYEPVANGSKHYVGKDGDLTAAKFITLRDDKDTGLYSYLTSKKDAPIYEPTELLEEIMDASLDNLPKDNAQANGLNP